MYPFGTASSPGAIVVTARDDRFEDEYELIDAEGQLAGAGLLGRNFDATAVGDAYVAGVDLEHMVGVSDGQLLVRNGDASWQEVTTPSKVSGYPWLGKDGVGAASSAGTTICRYTW